jgi:hypothetical protein
MKPWILVGGVALTFPVAASGQDYEDDDDRYGVERENIPLVPGQPDVESGFGMALMAGGGSMSRVSNSGGQGATDMGGAWLARVVWGTRSVLAGEVAYLGSAVPVNPQATGLAQDTTLLSNGGQVDLRLQAPIPLDSDGKAALAPFAVGGFALLRHDVIGQDGDFDDGTSAGDRLTAHIPVGAGLALMTGGFIADARFSYRPTVGGDDPVFSTSSAFDESVSAVSVTGSVGVEF